MHNLWKDKIMLSVPKFRATAVYFEIKALRDIHVHVDLLRLIFLFLNVEVQEILIET